mmetsp:Transcript_122872/g.348298  ORF Transcript_122872/g.348298 Transcript_122872/m.348298 type:complete len:219 (-) Transcript_122872:1415-2071(-)
MLISDTLARLSRPASMKGLSSSSSSSLAITSLQNWKSCFRTNAGSRPFGAATTALAAAAPSPAPSLGMATTAACAAAAPSACLGCSSLWMLWMLCATSYSRSASPAAWARARALSKVFSACSLCLLMTCRFPIRCRHAPCPCSFCRPLNRASASPAVRWESGNFSAIKSTCAFQYRAVPRRLFSPTLAAPATASVAALTALLMTVARALSTASGIWLR